METERITLSQRERDRLKVLHEVQQRHLTQVEAAARLKVTDRQVRRMLLRIREHGDAALVHGLRGRPSKFVRGFVELRLRSNGGWTEAIGCATEAAICTCGPAQNRYGHPQVLPAYGLQDLRDFGWTQLLRLPLP
jgi:hypothetical protein